MSMKVLIRQTTPYPSTYDIKVGDIVSDNNYGFCDSIIVEVSATRITLARPMPVMNEGKVKFLVENHTVDTKRFLSSYEVYLYGSSANFRSHVDNRANGIAKS
jgi:hypothetical protein